MMELEINKCMCFVRLSLLMTRVKKLKEIKYWSTNPLLEMSIFSKIIRWFFIMKILYFCKNDEKKN